MKEHIHSLLASDNNSTRRQRKHWQCNFLQSPGSVCLRLCAKNVLMHNVFIFLLHMLLWFSDGVGTLSLLVECLDFDSSFCSWLCPATSPMSGFIVIRFSSTAPSIWNMFFFFLYEVDRPGALLRNSGTLSVFQPQEQKLNQVAWGDDDAHIETSRWTMTSLSPSPLWDVFVSAPHVCN